MEDKDIPAARLANQRLSGDSFSSAQEAVAWFGAVQGQEYSLTKWSIGLRAPGLVDHDVERELTEGRILRTHLLRPTWHFVTNKDIRWILKLTAPTVHQASAFSYRSLELNQKLFLKANNVFAKALEGKALTRDDLFKELKRNRIIASGPRLAHLLMHAELDGLICSGPRLDKKPTYALLDERAAPMPAITRDEALYQLARTYFISRGPATAKDFATWSGLKVVDCKKGIASASPQIREEKIGDQTYYHSSKEPYKTVNHGMYFLPIYDEMIMGYKDRSALFAYRNTLRPPPKLRFNGMILSNGQVIGSWRRVDEQKVIKTQFAFFKRQDKDQKAAFKIAFDHLVQFSPRKVEVEPLSGRGAALPIAGGKGA